MKSKREKDELVKPTPAQESPRLADAEDFPLVGEAIPSIGPKRKTRLPLDEFGRRLTK